MRDYFCSALTVLALLAHAALVTAQDLQRPALSVNDTWTYRITEGPLPHNPAVIVHQQKITIVELRENQYRVNEVIIPVQGTGGEETSTHNWPISRDLNRYLRENAQLPFTELRFLQWPLKIGESWTFEQPLADGNSMLWHVKVDRWEDVAVPAGRFKAVVIEIDAQPKGGALYRQQRTLWFAPGTKSVVKHAWTGHGSPGTAVNRQIVFELESYELH